MRIRTDFNQFTQEQVKKSERNGLVLIANETLYQLSYTPIYLSPTAPNYARIKIDSKSIEQNL